MQLLYSNPLPGPEFVSLSLVLQPDAENPNGSGMGEPLLLASPLSTVSHHEATAALKELHKYVSSLSMLLNYNYSTYNKQQPKEVSTHDQMVAELMHDDFKLLLDNTPNTSNSNSQNKLQVFRPMAAHGMGLHYRLIRDDESLQLQNDLAALVLASSRSGDAAVNNNNNNNQNSPRNIEKQFLGVLLCVGMSGVPYTHCSSSLQYTLSQRVHDCIGLLASKRKSSGGSFARDVSAAKALLSTLLVTEEEARKTNQVADAAHSTAIPESGENHIGLLSGSERSNSHKKGSAFSNIKGKGKRLHVSKIVSKNINFAAGLLKGGGMSGDTTNLHVGESSTSNEIARALMERLTVLSVAEDNSFLRQYETSGQQRKANLDLTGNKSRFRKRKTDSNTNADLDAFDYRGPTRNSSNSSYQEQQLRLRRQHGLGLPQRNQHHHSASPPPPASKAHHGSIASSTASITSASTASSRNTFRKHEKDAQTSSRRNRAVPTLSAPQRDATSSRRPSASARMDDSEDDTRSRRSANTKGSRRAAAESQLMGDGSSYMEDQSEASARSQRLQVNVALNEDLTCSYKFSKMTSCSVEGVIQVQVKTNARNIAPFHMQVKDASQHIQTLQENKKFAEDVTPNSADSANRTFNITVPKADNYFPLIRYKCSGELRPVPIRVQTRVKVDNGFCRVALQISSNPHNEGSLTDLTIIMGVAQDIKGESLVTQPAGGVWNASKRSVIWCVSELGDGEKFQLQARFEIDSDSAAAKDDQDVPKFPVLVRCQCMYAQLSDVEVTIENSTEIPAEIAMKVARRFRLSHQERS